jgi:hypothetical protein
MDEVSWTEKRKLAVWHGHKSGYMSHTKLHAPHMTQLPREKIVKLSEQRPELLSASFSKVPWDAFFQFRYIVAVSGNSYSGLLKEALWSNSCVLRQDSHAGEWYERFLEPWVHYVPVEFDLSDLFEKIEWAISHDDECRKIAENGHTFAFDNFREESVDAYIFQTINNHIPG